MKTALVLIALALVGCTTCGCKGGLFGGAGADSGQPRVSMYTFNIAEGAKSAIIVGSAGTQSYMPQVQEVAQAVDATELAAATGPELTASGATNASVGKGQMVMLGMGASQTRSAELDLAAALQSLAGNTQTQAGQTPATTQRQGEATASPGAQTQTPTATKTTTVAPSTAVTGQGTANPIAQAAGPQSVPVQTVTPAPAAPAGPTQAELQAQYDQALEIATALGTGGGEGGVNTAAQAAAQTRLLEAERALNGVK